MEREYAQGEEQPSPSLEWSPAAMIAYMTLSHWPQLIGPGVDS